MRWLGLAAAAGMLLAGCTNASAPEDGATDSPSPTRSPTGAAVELGDPETVVGGLEVPWGIAFVDERTIMVTERSGRVRLIADGELQPEPLARIDVSAQGESGLHGIALHPHFPDARYAYVYYTSRDGNRVSRHRLAEDLSFGEEEPILRDIPSAQFHDGGRIAFGPDGMLYVATGDATEPSRAADRGSLAGKILRLTPEGEVPGDNPFDGSPVYSYGHRNPQGLAWGDDGRLFASEHGPTGEFGLCCRDEINVIEPGGFYGWPYRAGRDAAMSGEPPQDPIDPVASSGADTWAPAGLTLHPDAGVLVAALAGQRLMGFRLRGDGLRGPRTVLDGFGRLRAVAMDPDGCVYLTTSNTDGRGDPAQRDDRLLRACGGDA